MSSNQSYGIGTVRTGFSMAPSSSSTDPLRSGSDEAGARGTLPAPADIAGLSFEDALAELERIVRQLEDGRARLDEAISCYERGTALKRHCESRLREAQARVDRITVAADGSLGIDRAGIDSGSSAS
jgi:exodeoxyribonuclease VII small subunit